MTEPTTTLDLRTSLAQMSDTELGELLRNRPDLSVPLPPGVSSLASRITLPGSLARAIKDLSALEIAALETAGDLGAELTPVKAEAIVAKLPVSPALADEALRRLRAFALIFGTDSADTVQVTPGALGALPSGWRVLDSLPGTAEETTALIEQLDRPARAMLETLASSGSVGTTRDAAIDADPSRPIPRLIELGLLVRVNASTVRLPRPVRDIVRGETPRQFSLQPSSRIQGGSKAPEPTEISLIDDAATAQGLDATRAMRKIVTRLGREPIALNRDGSVGVRALSGLAKELKVDESITALLITIGESAGLIGRGEIEADVDGLAPTREALEWADATLSDQWAIVLAGWMASPWQVHLLNEKDAKGQPIRLLAEAMHDPGTRRTRTLILQQLTRVPGTQLQRADIVEDLQFSAPLAASGISESALDAVLKQARLVGGVANNASSSALVSLLRGEDIAQATRALVPAEVSYVIPQADMTILAPGPLPPEMYNELEAFADLESPGLASVFRVTESSARQALDAGKQPREIISWLDSHSPTGVPQPMAFLIEDAGRNHGRIRTGEALSYVRSDDESLITRAAGLLGPELTVIATQAAVSRLPLSELLKRLRDFGLQPIAEDASGASISMAPEPTLVRSTPSTLLRDQTPSDTHVAEAVASIRASDSAAPAAPKEHDGDHLSTLQAAARSSRQVAIGYVDKNGRGSQITVVPLSVTGGQVDGLNEKTGSVVRIALPRITKVILL
ncbi:helicase-associated domain-containing protein [Corynebacterium lubricantis]|uniref:helicase-associated domain-containing protein n=1 Tax=Corynebacterium lubricantis TaxID=541095 RepID=UPI000360BAB9|nr:helicase-associated domain-containing protein [Corynebacterium lubricantis]